MSTVAAQAMDRDMIEAGIAATILHVPSRMVRRRAVAERLWRDPMGDRGDGARDGARPCAALHPRDRALPPFIETPMTRSFLADAGFKASVVGRIKLGRLGQVYDLMGAILLL
ncbi:hypothetical protein [Falsiroseomonas sp.]|uniref:hypothetical protein n=1 Tax=Falsiroseomonas sp. TaxID=2870721 RepID=UPI0034A14FD1